MFLPSLHQFVEKLAFHLRLPCHEICKYLMFLYWYTTKITTKWRCNDSAVGVKMREGQMSDVTRSQHWAPHYAMRALSVPAVAGARYPSMPSWLLLPLLLVVDRLSASAVNRNCSTIVLRWRRRRCRLRGEHANHEWQTDSRQVTWQRSGNDLLYGYAIHRPSRM